MKLKISLSSSFLWELMVFIYILYKAQKSGFKVSENILLCSGISFVSCILNYLDTFLLEGGAVVGAVEVAVADSFGYMSA